jgi:hypothetical protein
MPLTGTLGRRSSRYITRMADFYPLIAKAVSALDCNTREARRVLYDRARVALTSEMRRADPALDQSDILVVRISLEEAIGRVEAEARHGGGIRRPMVATRSDSVPAQGKWQSGHSSNETNSAQGSDKWLSELLARASREEHEREDDQDFAPSRSRRNC